jgi:predicted Zn-dependent protease
MYMKNLLLLAPILFSLGCASWDEDSTAHVLIRGDQFDDEQLTAIHQATDQWEAALEGYIHFEYVTDEDHNNMIIVDSTTTFAIEQRYGINDIGECITVPWESGGNIQIARDIDQERFRRTALHEFGHAIGLSHDVSDTVMAPHLGKAAKNITCRDVWMFCDHNGCDGDELKICDW